MKPTHPVELLVCAIATQEGWFDDPSNIPRKRHNPCDLRFADQKNASAPGWNKKPPAPIATFTNDQTGACGGFRDIWAKVAEGYTVRKLLEIFAPKNENDTEEYIQNVLKWTGLPENVPVLNLLPPIIDMRKL